jgi:hypothetical protein
LVVCCGCGVSQRNQSVAWGELVGKASH